MDQNVLPCLLWLTASLLQSFYVNFYLLSVYHRHCNNHSNHLQKIDFPGLSAFCTHASSLQEKLVPCLPFPLIVEHKQEPAERIQKQVKGNKDLCQHHIMSLRRSNTEEIIETVLILMKQSISKQISVRMKLPDSMAA